MHKLFFIFLIFVFVVSCKKADDPSPSSNGSNNNNNTTKPDCETKNYGTVNLVNNSTNPYDVSINGNYVTRLPGKSNTSIAKITAGNYTTYVKQVSGYVLYPTEKNYNGTLPQCGTATCSFP